MKIKNHIHDIVKFVSISIATTYLYINQDVSQWHESLFIVGVFLMIYVSSRVFYELGRRKSGAQYEIGYMVGFNEARDKYTKEVKDAQQVALNARDSHWMYALETAKEQAVAITPELDHVYGFARQAVKHYQSPGNFAAPWTTSVKKKPRRKKRNRHSMGGPF